MTSAKKIPGLKIFLGIVVAMVTVVVGVGLWLAGSPTTERNRRFDEQRVNELQQVASAVDAFYDRTARLPASLDDLADAGPREFYVPSLVDPETKERYEYRVSGETTYELCATFAAATEEPVDARGMTKPVPAPMEPFGRYWRDWTHGNGRHCYSLDAQDTGARELCNLTNPCAAGQTCAFLPNRKGTYCVPQGKECLAAGCPDDRCVIMESYPVQVRCAGNGPAPMPDPERPTANGCQLMKEKGSGRVDCFGCGERVCKDPSPDWERYELPPDYVGIPYACYIDDEGACALAQ